MTAELQIFLLSMLPITELRAALPLALTIYQLDWLLAYFLTVIGNLIPVFFLLLYLKPFSEWFSKRFRPAQRFFNWWFQKIQYKITKKIKRYGCYLGLILFVAIPFPFTGAWSGSIAAFLLNIPFWKAFYLITIGVIIAGLIILFLTKLCLI